MSSHGVLEPKGPTLLSSLGGLRVGAINYWAWIAKDNWDLLDWFIGDDRYGNHLQNVCRNEVTGGAFLTHICPTGYLTITSST